jgi:hypothetical protein
MADSDQIDAEEDGIKTSEVSGTSNVFVWDQLAKTNGLTLTAKPGNEGKVRSRCDCSSRRRGGRLPFPMPGRPNAAETARFRALTFRE